MTAAAEEALVKIEAVLPDAERTRVGGTHVFAPNMGIADETRELIDRCEAAIERHAVLSFRYCSLEEVETDRSVQPLGLWFWGKVWTLVAWCELREDFRMFRLDRIADLKEPGDRYQAIPERSLAECLRQIEARYGKQS